MATPSVRSARRPPAQAPRRHASRTVRRRRTLVVFSLFSVIVVAFSIHAATTSGRAPTASRRIATTHSSSPRADVVTHLDATAAGWRLSVATSRAVAFSDAGKIVLAGGLDTAQNTLPTVVRIDPNSGRVRRPPAR